MELNGQTIDAVHHFTSGDNRLLHLHIDERAGGIDVTVPLCSDKPAYARSDRGREALGIGTDDQQQERELVADGGHDVEVGDVVTVRDEDRSADPGPWKVKNIDAGGEARLWSAWQKPRYEPVSDLNVVEKAEDTTLPHSVPDWPGDDDDDDGERLVADGGSDVPACTCGADLLETADLETDHYPVAGAREPCPRVEEGPAATCTACGESVGALFGISTVVAIWEARGEAPFGTDDDADDPVNDGDSGGELVTDGGSDARDDEEVRLGDIVTVRDDDDAGEWLVKSIHVSGTAVLGAEWETPRYEHIEDLEVVETASDAEVSHDVMPDSHVTVRDDDRLDDAREMSRVADWYDKNVHVSQDGRLVEIGSGHHWGTTLRWDMDADTVEIERFHAMRDPVTVEIDVGGATGMEGVSKQIGELEVGDELRSNTSQEVYTVEDVEDATPGKALVSDDYRGIEREYALEKLCSMEVINGGDE
ncbi:hypothetical protein C461_05282 [Halorubrum aidingense JCM 13560]|uniref:Uncharacterized protein n=1 Tax=Halorubrum aidingense JCM 13560 TaxID=1230454 RepID=M0PG06_9EURY|nr:hypothetical protein C461_05282 [Halorubrum aidingense JCM 13560]